MARYDRNRGMFFGCWDDTEQIPESGQVRTDSELVADFAENDGVSVFGTKVGGKSGEYVFNYNGDNWELNSKDVTLSQYGITVTGTPVAGNIIDVNYVAASGPWEALGKDNDSLAKELNPDTEKSKNVLGEAAFRHSGYEPEVSVDPYYIDPARKMYKRILRNAVEEKYGEGDLLGKFAEAFFNTKNTELGIMTGYCFVRDAWYVPQSTGGDTAAYGIPVTITPVGGITKKKIVYHMSNNEAEITDLDSGESPVIG